VAVGHGVAPPPPKPDTTRAIKSALRTSELAPATIAGQIATYLEILLAIGLASAWLEKPSVFVVSAVALGSGMIVGLTTPIGLRLIRVSGVVISLCALFVLMVAHALTDGRLLGDEPWLALLAVALVPIGLDWRVAARLRARTVCSGILVVPLVGAKQDWAYAGAIAWFVGALVTLWLLERDIRNATMRPVRLTPGVPPGRASVMDLVRTAGIGLAVGLVIAMLLADVRCTSPDDTPRFDVSGGSARFGEDGAASDGGSGATARVAPPSRALDAAGREYEYRIDDQGRRYVTGENGNRLYVEGQDDRTILRRDDGGIVAEIDENGITVYDRNGNAQLYVRDPDGTVLVPDADGEGQIPLPPSSGSGGLTGPDRGLVYARDEQGRIVVRDPDGSKRTYDRDAQGRDRVQVDDRNGTRTYVYDETGDTFRITEYDERGREIGEYSYDPQGRLIDESQGSNAGGSSSESSSSSAGEREADGAGGANQPPWGWIVGGLLVATAVAAAVLVLARRRPTSRRELDWAERLSARLDLEGRRRGRARGRSETVSAHASALAGGPLPDARLATVGQMVSAALFGRREPPAEVRTWADDVVDEVSNAHPPPTQRARWWSRRRRPTNA
jgi:YD repeat-containing protein